MTHTLARKVKMWRVDESSKILLLFILKRYHNSKSGKNKLLQVFPMSAVLKLGVAALLRVTRCQKRVAKFDEKKNLAYSAEKMTKLRVLTWYFSHLKGCKISWGSREFSDKFRGRQPKKFENPCPMSFCD